MMWTEMTFESLIAQTHRGEQHSSPQDSSITGQAGDSDPNVIIDADHLLLV